MQEHDKKYCSVAYGSKKLMSAERRYSTLEKVCLAIMWCVCVQISTTLGRQTIYFIDRPSTPDILERC